MAVTNVYLQEESGKYGRSLVFEYSSVYSVTHLSSDSTRDILTDASLPQPFEAHPNDFTAYVKDTSISRSIGEGRLKSTVNITYTTELDREEEPSDPLARPARISWGTQNERVPILIDTDGEAITNTAGDLLLGVEEDRALWVISVTKNVAGVPSFVTSYQNAVNSDAVVIGGASLAAGLLKMDSIEIGEQQEENGISFYSLGFKMLFRQDGWDQVLLNVGLREKVTIVDWVTETTTTELRPILTSAGEQVDEPVFLAANGEAIRENTGNPETTQNPLKTDLTVSEIITRTFSTKPSLPFSVLPLL